ncbi:MAG: DUF58 domain-containing protein [Verrucomicrobia bacterium]|nr:DUF58 domain-containing protein [Verrucomicrobiota bacterium]
MRIRLPHRTFIFTITREGGVFLLLIAVVGFVAFAKGINLIFLVLATMIWFAALSSIVSIASVNGLTVERVLPTHIFAGKAFAVELVLTNHKRVVPAISILVHDTLDGRRLEPRYVIKVPRRSTVSTTYPHVIERRGEFEFGEIVISTSFPLGFFMRGFAVGKPEKVIAYPRIVKLNPNFLAEVLSDIEMQLNKPGMGTEIFGFRRYVHGDDRRLINWKLSARTDGMIVTQFSQDQNLEVTIVFDNAPTGPGAANDERFEEMVTFAASLGSFFVEKGFKVQLVTRAGTVPFGEGNKQLLKMLTHLALIEPVEPSQESEDLYSPKQLGNSIGILIAGTPTTRPLPHYAHTFYPSGRQRLDEQRAVGSARH